MFAGYIANCVWCVYTVLVGYIHLIRRRRICGLHLDRGRLAQVRRDKAMRIALRKTGDSVDIVISNASSKPIYEQIVLQMKDAILSGELEEGALLPSIRSLAGDLRISVITTKRAYAELEAQGFIETVQGKGSFVAGGNTELLREERLRHIEELLGRAMQEAQGIGLGLDEVRDMLDALSQPE